MEFRHFAAALAFGLVVVSSASVFAAEPKAKVLAVPEDPTEKAVLIGRVNTGTLVFQLELEGAEAMWMLMEPPMGGAMGPAMGGPGGAMWGEDRPAADERYHVEFKLDDPKSGTRVSYSKVTFEAVNTTTGKKVSLILPPMWGSSGLHYSANAALAGDGVYAATVTADVPAFAREMADKGLWSKPAAANFHFRLQGGKVTEVSVID